MFLDFVPRTLVPLIVLLEQKNMVCFIEKRMDGSFLINLRSYENWSIPDKKTILLL